MEDNMLKKEKNILMKRRTSEYEQLRKRTRKYY